MTRTPALWLVPLLALGLAGCAMVQKPLPQEPGLHPRLTPNTYIEEGKLAVLTVDTAAALRREKEAYIPLPISVGNKSLKKLTLTRESFTLVDDQGNRYPLASVTEARTLGSLTTQDFKVSEFYFEVMNSNFTAYTFVPSTFFPTLTGGRHTGVVQDRVQLNERMWTGELMYFPHPKGELAGRVFELWVTAPELADPLFVKFRMK